MTEMVETLINNRWPILLPAHRAARESWAWHEAARFAAMSTVIGPGDVVWDIGAEEGDHAALYAMWGAQVVLCEPNPKAWPNIRAIWEANGLAPPLMCWAGFIGDEITPDTSGNLGVTVLNMWPAVADGEVVGNHGSLNLSDDDFPCKTIDYLTPPAPTVLTIDVEGSELQVLRGAKHTLEEHRPHVFVSLHPEMAAYRYGQMDIVKAVRWYMEERGYPNGGAIHLATDHEQHWYFRP